MAFGSSKLSSLEKVSQKQQQKNQYRLSSADKPEADRFEEVLNAIKISKVDYATVFCLFCACFFITISDLFLTLSDFCNYFLLVYRLIELLLRVCFVSKLYFEFQPIRKFAFEFARAMNKRPPTSRARGGSVEKTVSGSWCSFLLFYGFIYSH